MAAPEGNKFWELRSKHGRNKLFETPELMWEAACEYFQWCDDNPFVEEDFVGGGNRAGEKVFLNRTRPFTLHGLCIYLGCSTGYFREFKKDCSEDFVSVIRCIEDIVYNQKFGGAAAGFFNANIIARDLGLREKTEFSTPPDGEGEFKLTLNIT